MSRKGWLFGVIGVVVVAVVAGFLAYKLVGTTQQTPASSAPSISPPTSVEVPSTQAAPPPAPPAIRHDPVAQAMPTRLEIGKEGEAPLLRPPTDGSSNMDPNPAKMDSAGQVLPNTLELPAVQNDPRLDWAVLPGTGIGTTVIVCHTLATADPPLPCNALTSIPAESDSGSGYQLELTSPTGVLRSELVDVHLLPKDGAGSAKYWEPLFAKTPDRTFVVMCELQLDPATGMYVNTTISRMLEFHLVESVSVS